MTKKGLAICIGGIIVVVLIYGGFILYMSWPVSFGNLDKAGVFGDSFGVLTSLFSGLAFAVLIFTMFLQREELQEQREELRLTREEFKTQNLTSKRQNFESTFFQMLRLHNDIVNSMDVETGFVGSATEHHGRDCFGVFYNNLRYRYESIKADSPDLLEEEAIKFIYELFWEQYQNELGHYFRYLYTMFKFIKTSDVEDKRLYSNIVRAQLSDQELLIIFYNCLYLYGRKKFKPLVEEFAIFDNLPDSLLLNIKHKEFYLPNAFGDR